MAQDLWGQYKVTPLDELNKPVGEEAHAWCKKGSLCNLF